jgi:hypothetical protein
MLRIIFFGKQIGHIHVIFSAYSFYFTFIRTGGRSCRIGKSNADGINNLTFLAATANSRFIIITTLECLS